ncbi:UDP-N-acetylglucosamine 1-carboxyvinyltransferase [Thermosulfurimonas sp. F29]|uniref:UDP-N-acetylglucosamine 1-carboxyvinyltransferase n=1 Tax=Thermosulfurimonas sp. F29 TaxID=2867247 RepID=UPI001C83EF0A|nr:UDP-N-acetylglucosamine 1-carboxyvinyltransferase [Thermosulfurimonas sp. F29]MBX6423856.1 UDP-N-acetylglucosamine 1-carboxyvinyltransferase [Thermosulfurimonas sp. F29]
MREYLEIEGGYSLSGEIVVSGAKNAVLPALAATLLAPGRYRFTNWPRLRDLCTMLELLGHLGARVEVRGEVLEVDTSTVEGMEAPYELVRRMRASILVLGPLVARFGRARVAMPGGCPIGKRPVDFHLRGLERLGARITLEHGYILTRADEGLRGAEIVFDFPSVTATENLMMAAVLARGRTEIHNAAREPEVVFLGEMLRAMGARIEGLGTDHLIIHGRNELSPPPAPLSIIPDRIEAGTYLMLPGLIPAEITLVGAEAAHLETPIARLREAGLEIEVEGNRIHARAGGRLRPLRLATAPYPGFPTDLQAQIMALLTRAQGLSFITENLFEKRFQHVFELRRMGADIEVDERTAVIRGPVMLQGAEVEATDLRASACLVLAALSAEGITRIYGLEHLDRGYEGMEKKLRALGARIERKRYEGPASFGPCGPGSGG